ncbi:MAG: methyltransferase domain-containing protein [Planctomycetaceae bacterium]
MERDLQPEEMDDPHLPEGLHHDALRGLARLNSVTGVGPAMYRRLRRYARELGRPVRLLDIGTASGDMPIYWTRQAAREGLAIHCTGVDISEGALTYAKARAAKAAVDVRFIQRDVLSDRLPTGYDVITCGLFMHHLSEPQIARLLTAMQAAAGHAIVICDLERSLLNLAGVWIASRALSRSKIVHHDAIRSVRSALTRHEFRIIAEQSLGRPIRVEGLPPCRFIATLDEAVARAPEVALTGLQSA